MSEYIEKQVIYRKIAKLEEEARNQYLDTMFDSPARTRYQSQMNERTRLKHMIADEPAADVRPVVRGRWEWMGPCRDSGGRLWATCTACGLRQRLGDFTMFCPHCGADMRGGEENG